MKGRQISYSHCELAWIEAHRRLSQRELHVQFCARFNRTDVSQQNLTALCKRRGWLTGRTGCFPKGHVPDNKGKKMPYNPASAATRFKKGHRGGRAAERYKPIGTERLSKEGYVERKIHDDMPLQSRWRAVHLIRWEERHGQVPEGHCLKCLDGNKANTDPSNWEMVPRALLPRLNGRFGRNYDDAPAELKPTIMVTAKLEHAAREARNNRKE